MKVDDVYCLDCEEDAIYADLKEEPSGYKVGALCADCNRDYGVLHRIPRRDIDRIDDAWTQAEEIVRQYLD